MAKNIDPDKAMEGAIRFSEKYVEKSGYKFFPDQEVGAPRSGRLGPQPGGVRVPLLPLNAPKRRSRRGPQKDLSLRPAP